jgi:SAM-dependent methyltransferase
MSNDSTPMPIGKAEFYDQSYQQENYFPYQSWLYEPFISSLVAFCGLKKGASILDVGCGQGFFSYLFSKQGMKVCGIDISETGVRKANNSYGRLGISFAVSDIRTATFSEPFDCIFVRSCSLYNTDDFRVKSEITDRMLRHLKPTGTFIFVYNSNCSSKPSPTWRYHSLDDVREHFGIYANVQIFFLTKITACLLRRHSMCRLVTLINIFLSKVSGIGGEIVCILKTPAAHSQAADPISELRSP